MVFAKIFGGKWLRGKTDMLHAAYRSGAALVNRKIKNNLVVRRYIVIKKIS